MTTIHCNNQQSDNFSNISSNAVTTEPLTIKVYDQSQTDDCLQMWKMLETQFADVPLMCSHAWTSTWIEHYQDLMPYSFVVASKGNIPCGICLLTEGVDQHDGPLSVKTLHLGTAGEPTADSVCVEYNTLLVKPEDQHSFIAALLDDLSQNDTWDSLLFDGFA